MRIVNLAAALTVGIAMPGHCAIAGELAGVVNARGQALAVVVDVPRSQGRFPAVVLAPGQGYHMALPAMEATARALVEQGVAVFRFNWAYFTAEPKGRPSDDLSKELQDLQAVLAVARKHPQVDAAQVAVGGKSLDSLTVRQFHRRNPGRAALRCAARGKSPDRPALADRGWRSAGLGGPVSRFWRPTVVLLS